MKKSIFGTLIAVVAIATSCSDNSNFDASYDGAVRITSDITTRVVGTQWEASDAIGVYMSSTSGSLGSLGENVEYVTASGDGNFTSTDALYYPVSGNVDFLAYYPYVANSNFDATAYSVNVASQTDLPAIDLMTATATNVAKSSAAVNLAFTHKLSNIVLTVNPGDDWTASDLAGLTVKLVGTDTEAAYNLEWNDITLGGAVADITFNTTADGTSAEAIVIPQTLTDAKFSFTTAKGTTIDLVIPTAAFVSGSQYVYDVTIDGSGVKFNNATIDGWGTGNTGITETNEIVNKTWGDATYYIFIEVVTEDAVFFTYYDETYGAIRYYYDYTFDVATQTIYFMSEGVEYLTFVIQEDGSVYNDLNNLTLPATADLVADTDDNIFKNTLWVESYGYTIDFLTNKYCNLVGYGEEYTFDESAGTLYFETFGISATYTDTQITISGFYSDGSDGVFTKQ